jgi:hypothetical protein
MQQAWKPEVAGIATSSGNQGKVLTPTNSLSDVLVRIGDEVVGPFHLIPEGERRSFSRTSFFATR